MAPRANWKGFLRLSLVTCPVALYPATSDAEKISFNQINKKTDRVSASQYLSLNQEGSSPKDNSAKEPSNGERTNWGLAFCPKKALTFRTIVACSDRVASAPS